MLKHTYDERHDGSTQIIGSCWRLFFFFFQPLSPRGLSSHKRRISQLLTPFLLCRTEFYKSEAGKQESGNGHIRFALVKFMLRCLFFLFLGVLSSRKQSLADNNIPPSSNSAGLCVGRGGSSAGGLVAKRSISCFLASLLSNSYC